jgi:hypothetical protein
MQIARNNHLFKYHHVKMSLLRRLENLLLQTSDRITLFYKNVLNFPTGLPIFKSISMIYFCVKTDEFLASILDKVSLGAQYYCQFDVPLAKAESIIEKLKKRYVLDQTARQRNYRMQQKLMPVVDLVVLLNQSLYMAEKVRLCLLCTMPVEMRPIALNCSEVLRSSYQLEKSELDHFFSVLDRKNRLFYMSIANPLLLKSARDTLKSVAVYELVQIPYTLEQRKQKNIPQNKAQGWTWRLHKEFMSLKKHSYQMCLRNSNRIKKIILYKMKL